MRGVGKVESNFSKDFYNRECHIIGIGIDKYKYKDWPILNNCEKDVERFISTVCGSFKTFEDSTDYVTRLYNEDANKLLIGDTIKGKLRELKSHQNLIIYFAGHGKDHEKEAVSYLAPFDAKSDYVNLDNSKLISYQDIFKWISNTNALHIVLILDCCHAGRIMNAKRSTTPDRFEKIENFEEYINLNLGYADFKSQMKEKSAWVITSGSDNDKVSDGDALGSPFSQALNKVLTGSAKFNKPLSVAYLGSVLKNHFHTKHKYKPDFKRLSELLDYKSNKGEFVFEPLEKKVKKEDEKIVSVNKAQREESNSANVPNFEKERPISSPNFEIEETQKEVYVNKGIEPITSNIPFITAFVLILSIIILILTHEKKDRIETEIISTENTLNETPLSYYPPIHIDTPNASTLGKNNISRFAEKKKGRIFKPSKRIKKYVERVIDIDKPFDEDKIINENPNIVFVGSFENKSNAEILLERLKEIGYQDAEILMKENLPYAIVITGFYQFKSSAKAEVKAMKKRGIDVYYSNTDLSKIYRKKINRL